MLELCRGKYEWINNFTIYGERSSGTKFLEECIISQFGLNVTYFYGWKHFFGWTKPETITYKGRHTLFFCIVRSPYEWLLSMMKHPHHVPKENKSSLKTLFHNEWYSVDRTGKEIMEDRNFTTSKTNPLRYKNIFELRNTKYRYLCETMPVIASNYVLFSYDTFLKNHYNYLNIIGNRFDLKTVGKPPSIAIKSPKTITDEHRKFIEPYLDWKLEESLGYFKK
jgi:hypothetical protein